MITKEDRDRLRQLHSWTLPEPWEAHWDGTLGRTVVYGKQAHPTIPDRGVGPSKLVISITRATYGNVPPEADFIIAAHQMVPGLLDAIEQRDAQIALLRAVLAGRHYEGCPALASDAAPCTCSFPVRGENTP